MCRAAKPSPLPIQRQSGLSHALGRNGKRQVSAEGVGHGVEGLHRGKPPGSQVPPDLIFQPQEKSGPVTPVADALQAVHQVGKGLGKVGSQRQGLQCTLSSSWMSACACDLSGMLAWHRLACLLGISDCVLAISGHVLLQLQG